MRFVLHLLAALLLIEEDASCHEDGTADGERLADGSAQRTPGEGWSKLMEDLIDLRKVLPEASGTAGFFWNGLSFDCFPIVCSQTRRLKKAAEPAAHK